EETMKKFLMFCLTMSMIFSVEAMECADGVLLRANNGTEYCKSHVQLGWKEAGAWCHAQNMKLVSWEELCPDSVFGKNCNNLKGTGVKSVWTATPHDTRSALRINLSCGCTNHNAHTKMHFAICK
ncbi:MAG: hypothetical protein ACI4OR_04705, partial [Alphaproteobacteria bacterium]